MSRPDPHDAHVRDFPTVISFDGGPSADCTSLLIEAKTGEGRVMRFAVPIDDVKHVITFLLAWAGRLSAGLPEEDEGDRVGAGILPIPATSIAVGEPSGGQGFIGISVGRAELLFSLPQSAFGPLGQTLLMAAGPASTVPS